MLLNIGAPDFFIKCSNPTTAAQVLQRVAAYCDALTLIKQFAPTPWLVDARTIVVWIHLLLPPLVSEFVSELAATDLRRMEIAPHSTISPGPTRARLPAATSSKRVWLPRSMPTQALWSGYLWKNPCFGPTPLFLISSARWPEPNRLGLNTL